MEYVTHELGQKSGVPVGHPLPSKSQVGHTVVRHHADARGA